MPNTTCNYPFEWTMLEFASELSLRLTCANSTFLMVLNDDGIVEKTTFNTPGFPYGMNRVICRKKIFRSFSTILFTINYTGFQKDVSATSISEAERKDKLGTNPK